jgi:hypothetical protein
VTETEQTVDARVGYLCGHRGWIGPIVREMVATGP